MAKQEIIVDEHSGTVRFELQSFEKNIMAKTYEILTFTKAFLINNLGSSEKINFSYFHGHGHGHGTVETRKSCKIGIITV